MVERLRIFTWGFECIWVRDRQRDVWKDTQVKVDRENLSSSLYKSCHTRWHETEWVELKAQGGEESLTNTLVPFSEYLQHSDRCEPARLGLMACYSSGCQMTCYLDILWFINVLLSQSTELDFTCSSHTLENSSDTNARLSWDEPWILKKLCMAFDPRVFCVVVWELFTGLGKGSTFRSLDVPQIQLKTGFFHLAKIRLLKPYLHCQWLCCCVLAVNWSLVVIPSSGCPGNAFYCDVLRDHSCL